MNFDINQIATLITTDYNFKYLLELSDDQMNCVAMKLQSDFNVLKVLMAISTYKTGLVDDVYEPVTDEIKEIVSDAQIQIKDTLQINLW
jgi:hypothetical protein